MPKGRELKLDDDIDWAERCNYWENYRPITRGRPKLIKYREPLIISGHGARIKVDHNTLLIRNGFTHHPQKLQEVRLFPGDPNLPDRIINLDGSGGITFDALNWMTEQKISFVQLNWRGQVNFSGNSGFAADPKLVRLQTEIRGSKIGLAINRKLILAKFDNCVETLEAIFPNSAEAKAAVEKIIHWKSEIANSAKSHSLDKILGYEGAAATAYHKPWHELPLKWSRLSERPIPRDWHRIGPRSMSWQRGANNARHPLNAMLNYGYAVLISDVQTSLVAVGYDPSIGIAHRRVSNPIPLVYDLMEPLRPIIDRETLRFALAHTFTPGDFSIGRAGACRLNPHMARILTSRIVELGIPKLVEQYLQHIMH